MFEFFLALFGGLFYGKKYSGAKTKLKAYDDRRNVWISTLEDIQSRYVASMELERGVKDLILKGNHFEDICNWLSEDFRYVFGANWKDKLSIPPRAPVLDPETYKNDAYSFSIPANHITWVYHLLLAKKGKIDHKIPLNGYDIGGMADKDMTIKFAECIEGRLLKAGVHDVRLVLELDMMCGARRRLPTDVCGGNIKIESLCHHPTHRLWEHSVQK